MSNTLTSLNESTSSFISQFTTLNVTDSVFESSTGALWNTSHLQEISNTTVWNNLNTTVQEITNTTGFTWNYSYSVSQEIANTTTRIIWNNTNTSVREIENTTGTIWSNISKAPLFVNNDEILNDINKKVFQTILIPSFVYLCILLVLGIPGNSFVIYVYGWKWSKTTSRIFVLTLAVIDFLNCVVSIPTEMALLVNFLKFDHPHFCQLSRTIMSFCNNSSSIILLAIVIDRYRRICKPLSKSISVKVAKKIVIAAVVVSILTSWPFVLLYGTYTVPIPIPPPSLDQNVFLLGKTCLIKDTIIKTIYPLILVIFLIFSQVACDIFFAVLYSCIAKSLFRQQRFRQSIRSGRYQAEMSSSGHTQDELDVPQQVRLNFMQELNKSINERQATETKPTEEESFDSNGVTQQKYKSLSKQHSKNKSPVAKGSFFKRQISKLSLGSKTSGGSHQSRKTTLMLFLVTLVFIISFIPYCIVVIIRSTNPQYYNNLSTTGKALFQLFLRSYFLSSALNPLIYSYVSKSFRVHAKSLFGKCCRLKLF